MVVAGLRPFSGPRPGGMGGEVPLSQTDPERTAARTMSDRRERNTGDQAAEPGAPLGAGSLFWDIAGEYRSALIAPSALLLQVTHPMVSVAVARHSAFQRDPWARAMRTGNSMLKFIYGGPLAIAEGRRLRDLHGSFQGVDEHGRRYHALNGPAYAWVNCTFFESYRTARRVFGKPLDDRQQRQLYAESLQLGRILQVPEREMPPTLEDFQAYFRDAVAHRLENTTTAQALLAALREPVRPPREAGRLAIMWPVVREPLRRLGLLVTIGTLPPEVRKLLGLRWTRAEQLQLDAVAAAVRAGYRLLPERRRYMPVVARVRSGELRPGVPS
jgi:uncharacterized protein (DUF2236 family)